MIEVSELSFTYPGGRRLDFGSFKVDQGRHCLILGDSGSGKTTLLHLMGGLLRGYQGTIAISRTVLSSLSDVELDRFRGQHVGFIFQKLHLIKSLTVKQNLLMAPWLSGSTPHQPPAEVLTRLSMGEKLDSRVGELSHGQSQRVAIARAVINKPRIILADEPTSALDDRNCDDVLKLLLSAANESGSTLVIATHDQRLKSRIDNRIQITS